MSKKTPSSAFALSLAGGILIILGSIVSLLFFSYFWSSTQDRMGGMMGGGMMGGGMMGGMVGGWFLSIPIIAGILVVIGAIMLNFRSQQNILWGIIIVIFSVVGFTGMGISFIGSILGIIGGALALSRR